MANRELLEEQREETRLIIEELLEDGSDPDALYTIEHHLSAEKFEVLEQAGLGIGSGIAHRWPNLQLVTNSHYHK